MSLLDFAAAWIDSYIEDNNLNLPYGVREKDIHKLHSHLCAAVEGFMTDAEITNPDYTLPESSELAPGGHTND